MSYRRAAAYRKHIREDLRSSGSSNVIYIEGIDDRAMTIGIDVQLDGRSIEDHNGHREGYTYQLQHGIFPLFIMSWPFERMGCETPRSKPHT